MSNSTSDSIYVTLVSTASANVYGETNNTSSHFTNRLKNPLRLEGGGNNWDVALLDIQLPPRQLVVPTSLAVLEIVTTSSLWKTHTENPILYPSSLAPHIMQEVYARYRNTVNPNEARQVYSMWSCTYKDPADPYNTDYRKYTLRVPAGTYATNLELVTYIDIAVRTLFLLKGWRFMEYDAMLNRVCYYLNRHMSFIVFLNNELTQMLGLTARGENDLGYPTAHVTMMKQNAPYPPDIKSGQPSYFVYTDCADVCNIGDSMGQLLRQIDSPESNALSSFSVPYYKPVMRSTIESIEIDIRNIAGENPKFRRGNTTCTLHFRKRI